MKRLALAAFALVSACYLLAAPVDAQFRRECRYGFCVPSHGASGTPISNACSVVSGTTVTFTGQIIGGANANRISVVSINWSDSTLAGTAQITAVTIGGVSMSKAVSALSGPQNSNAEIWWAPNPTGSTANIVITAATAINGVTIEVYSLIGYNSIAPVTSTTGTTSVSQAYTNKQLAIAAGSRTTNVSTSLSNMTNDFSSACGASLWGVHASQRLNGNGTLTSAISPSTNSPEIALAVWSQVAPASCAQSSAFLARTSGLDQLHTTAYNALICGLVTDGIFSKLDVLHIYATQNTTTAQLNLVSSSFPATIHGAPTFTPDRGYTGVNASSTIFIDTGFNPTTAPSPQYTQDSAHYSGWTVTPTGANGQPFMGSSNGATLSYMTPREGTGTFTAYINTGSSTSLAINAGITGLFSVNRSASNRVDTYVNSTAFTNSAAVSGALANLNMYTLGDNAAGTANGCNMQTAMVTFGSSLNSTQQASLYNRARTYMSTVGVP